MYLHKLNLTNMRAFRTAEFDFLGQPGVHLIVGVNGVGKSTALEALRVLLSQLLPQFVATGVRGVSFSKDDITQGEPYLVAQLTGQVLHYPFRYTIDRKAAAYVPETGPVQGGQGPQVIETPDAVSLYLDTAIMAPVMAHVAPLASPPLHEQDARLKDVQQYLRKGQQSPLAVYYSPHRSLINNTSAKASRAKTSAAYIEALDSERTFSAKAFADWWRTRQVLAAEQADTATIDALTTVFNQVVNTFLNNCKDLQLAPPDDERQLLLTKNGYQLSVRQLSDGERSILTLALDLARRLYLANSNLSNPVQEGQAIVLIDELDLHLHPGWQRDVVKRLEKTFPKCQFICSTHSAQIIGEVEPDYLTWIGEGKPPKKRSQSYGLDAS